MSKRFLLIVAICVIGLIAIFIFTKPKSNTPSGSSGGQASNHVEGTSPKGVTLVEYGDYQCPVCEAYYATVKQVAAQFSTQIVFQFRNLPLFQIHQNAFAGARAAEAASLQGKFWEMHDMLYEQQNSWSVSSTPISFFDAYAQQLGLNKSQFDADYSSSKVNDTINADLAAFNKTGQQEATPTFFLDGKFVDNNNLVDKTGPSVAKFASVINAELASKK